MSRRGFLTTTTATGLAAAAAPLLGAAPRRYQNGASPWPLSLDTAVIRPAGLIEKIEAAAEAGYDGIEPWEGELNEYEQGGGDLKDLGRRIADLGLSVPNIVALWNAIPRNREEWDEVLPEHRRRMRQAADVGATYIQTVCSPARPWEEFDLEWAAARYRDLLEIGIGEFDVVPALNFLKFFPHVRRMGQAAAIALDCDHPRGCIIPDTFHMYVGGSGWEGLRHLQGHFIAVFQINDVPDDPPREQLEDEHRIYPGDGILPLERVLRDLRSTGFTGAVSLQLFNRSYWQQDPVDVARTGRRKMLEVIGRALDEA